MTPAGPRASRSSQNCSADPGGSAQRVAQVKRPDRVRMLVRRIVEATVHALIGGSVPLVGALDTELAVRQRIAGHLDPAEAFPGPLGQQEHVEVDLGAEDL